MGSIGLSHALLWLALMLMAACGMTCQERIQNNYISLVGLDFDEAPDLNLIEDRRAALQDAIDDCGLPAGGVNVGFAEPVHALELAVVAADTDLVSDVVSKDFVSGVRSDATELVGAIHVAARYSTPPVIELLVDRGAHINATDAKGYTPLMNSLGGYQRDLENTRKLISLGADIDAVADDGSNAITFAVSERDYDALRLLLELGADPHSNPDLPDLVVRLDDPSLIEAFSEYGIDMR